MEFFIELVAEALVASAKESPEEMPEIEYKEHFVVRHPRKKTLAHICASLIWVVAFTVLYWILFEHETRYLMLIFAILGAFISIFAAEAFSYRCSVDETEILQTSFWIFKKKVQWSDVSYARVLEKTGDKTVIIALYNANGKFMIDFLTGMENAWHVVKMAEQKGIEIKKVRDSLRDKKERLSRKSN